MEEVKGFYLSGWLQFLFFSYFVILSGVTMVVEAWIQECVVILFISLDLGYLLFLITLIFALTSPPLPPEHADFIRGYKELLFCYFVTYMVSSIFLQVALTKPKFDPVRWTLIYADMIMLLEGILTTIFLVSVQCHMKVMDHDSAPSLTSPSSSSLPVYEDLRPPEPPSYKGLI